LWDIADCRETFVRLDAVEDKMNDFAAWIIARKFSGRF
jgi:hypothetical protein